MGGAGALGPFLGRTDLRGQVDICGGEEGGGGSEGEREQDGVDVRGQVCIPQAGGERGVKVGPCRCLR